MTESAGQTHFGDLRRLRCSMQCELGSKEEHGTPQRMRFSQRHQQQRLLGQRIDEDEDEDDDMQRRKMIMMSRLADNTARAAAPLLRAR